MEPSTSFKMRNPAASAVALRSTPGFVVAASSLPEDIPAAHVSTTIDMEDSQESHNSRHKTESEDKWEGRRASIPEEVVVPDMGGDASVVEPLKTKNPKAQAPERHPPEPPRVKPPTTKKVKLETEHFSVTLRVIDVEVNRPFLVLIHNEKPDFEPKERCKFLATVDGDTYDVDFIGIQFPILSYGLYITCFLFRDTR